MKQEKETPIWLTILKLVVLATVLIGGVGLVLWWAARQQSSVASPAVSAPSQPWGIVGDSPIRNKR
jgi:uncharacterized iron-regulated membrane protein